MKKIFVKLICLLFPQWMATRAYKALSNPKTKKLRPHEEAVLDSAQNGKLTFKHFDIQTYFWKGGSKKVLLVHGWEGQAGNFSDFILALQAMDLTILAFDAPCHGSSGSGPTSLFDFTDTLEVVLKDFQPNFLISHSFGGVASSFVLSKNRDMHIEKYAMIAPPNRFSDRIDDVCSSLGITRKVQSLLIERLEKETKEDISKMNVSDFVQVANVGDALLLHDKDDRVESIERSRAIHKEWPQSTLSEVQGTGHFRILRTAAVIEKVESFLKG